jgi:hypothetical protein
MYVHTVRWGPDLVCGRVSPIWASTFTQKIELKPKHNVDAHVDHSTLWSSFLNATPPIE